MKAKKILPLLLITLCFLATGCNKKNELKCERIINSSKDEIKDFKEVVNLEYENDKDKVTSSTIDFYITFSDAKEDDINTTKERFERYCDDKEDIFEDCKVTSKDNEMIIKVKGKIEDIGIDGISNDTSYDDAKKVLEADNYTCK